MSFVSRDRQAGDGVDPDRVPPGQYVTARFPVFHAGVTPTIDLATWDFSIEGLVLDPVKRSIAQIKAMPTSELTYDIHCVTKWTKLDTTWTGVRMVDLLEEVEVNPAATHVVVFAEHGFTANLPIDDFMADTSMLAWLFDAEELELEHGWPLRLVAPHLLFLEIGQMGSRDPIRCRGRAGFLGAERLSHVWRPVERTALLGRLGIEGIHAVGASIA